MFDGFDTRGCVGVEIVDYGFVHPAQVTRLTLRAHYADAPPREVDIDLGVRGINYETLEALVRRVNADLRRGRQ